MKKSKTSWESAQLMWENMKKKKINAIQEAAVKKRARVDEWEKQQLAKLAEQMHCGPQKRGRPALSPEEKEKRGYKKKAPDQKRKPGPKPGSKRTSPDWSTVSKTKS